MFILNALLLSFAFSLSYAAALPLISLEQLNTGNSFTWSYFDLAQSGAPYSTEQYEVIERKGPFVTIVMSTRLDYRGEKDFHPTHKFIVDYRKCEAAHKNPRQKMNFLIDLYPATGNGYFAPRAILTPALAFEEKFNCHPHLRRGWPEQWQTIFSSEETLRGNAVLFQQKRTPADQITGFYFLADPQLRGVLYRKDFNPDQSNHFRMQLVQWLVR